MNRDTRVIACRANDGVTLVSMEMNDSVTVHTASVLRKCRVLSISRDGSQMATSDGESVKIFSMVAPFDKILELDPARSSRVAALEFSPKGTFLATWEMLMGSTDASSGPSPNLHIWEVQTGTIVASFVQRKQLNWCPQWSRDEGLCTRAVNNEVVCYENNVFDTVKHKLHLPKLADYVVADKPSAPHYLAVHVPGSKGQPSFVRLFEYPNFGGPTRALANKSFYKSEKAELFWNSKGTSLLILTSTEASAASYYGEQSLHYVDIRGESCIVPRGKEGPVYSVSWNPKATDFCAVYGSMPAKATLYNLKCEPIFDYGTGPRNCVFYNAFGSLLCIAGFGNLRGNIEIWDLKSQRKICNPQAPDSTSFEWCPDGEHFLTATTTPRLRVGNGYKIWKYNSAEPLVSRPAPNGIELYEAVWKGAAEGTFSEADIKQVKTTSAAAKTASAPQAYVPPALRNNPQAANAPSKPKYREDYEPPSNMKQQANQQPPSKAAIKNKKKREAKARKKLEQLQLQGEDTTQ